ncbi:MAG: hypothetical protein KF744_15555 [Taibaiella sp.]|nr:hypothetical protein [Taibaiella sp.]
MSSGRSRKVNSELSALLRLVDDPDDEIFGTVADRLLGYGKEIIPSLENLWESTADEQVQERMEQLIHRVHFNDLQQEMLDWSRLEQPDILRGAILVAKYRFPDLNVPSIFAQFDQIRRNVWLELNNYMTPLEQVNVLNSILYNYCKFEGQELTKRETKHFFVNQLFDSKQGNAYAIGAIYLAVCETLDIPIFAVEVPRQFIFAYIDTLHSFFSTDREGVQQIQFYIDPTNGIAYTQKDLDMYLRKINATDRESYFRPLTSRRVICKMLEELALCYRYQRDENSADEIQQLMQLIIMDEAD